MTAAVKPSLASVGILDPLEYTEVWAANTRDPEPIDAMSAERRLNLALGLYANADAQARRYELVTAWDYRPCATIVDPRAWIVTTPVFRALVADLPGKRLKLIALDERARHLGSCAAGIGGALCGCEPRPATDRDVLLAIAAAKSVTA